MSVEVQTGPAVLDGVSEDRECAQRVATSRRRRRQLQEIVIRLVSLTVVLGLWQVFGARVDPVLFTTPWAIAKAAVVMIGSGELWNYLWPSLVVLALGLTAAAIIGIAMGLLLARFWVLDVALGVYITFLYSTPTVALVPLIVLWAGFETMAKVIILFLFAFFPMVINTYQGVKNVDPRLARCPSSSPACASPSAAA
jgi:ABC-type nitrate/sulfonate/bicarbonate transport system permease component